MLKTFEHKINDVVEQRDRVLTTQLQNALEERRLEIAAATERKKMVEILEMNAFKRRSFLTL